MNTTKLRTPYSVKCEHDARNRQERVWTVIGSVIAALFIGLCLLLLNGCATTSPNAPMSHAVFTAAVTLGEQIGLETHPEATPYVRAAAGVVCSVANGTNVTPAEIVKALEAANVTNSTARIIINGSLAILNVVVAGLGTNDNEIRLYGKDLCQGMQLGLPPDDHSSLIEKHAKKGKVLPPHLR